MSIFSNGVEGRRSRDTVSCDQLLRAVNGGLFGVHTVSPGERSLKFPLDLVWSERSLFITFVVTVPVEQAGATPTNEAGRGCLILAFCHRPGRLEGAICEADSSNMAISTGQQTPPPSLENQRNTDLRLSWHSWQVLLNAV